MICFDMCGLWIRLFLLFVVGYFFFYFYCMVNVVIGLVLVCELDFGDNVFGLLISIYFFVFGVV